MDLRGAWLPHCGTKPCDTADAAVDEPQRTVRSTVDVSDARPARSGRTLRYRLDNDSVPVGADRTSSAHTGDADVPVTDRSNAATAQVVPPGTGYAEGEQAGGSDSENAPTPAVMAGVGRVNAEATSVGVLEGLHDIGADAAAIGDLVTLLRAQSRIAASCSRLAPVDRAATLVARTPLALADRPGRREPAREPCSWPGRRATSWRSSRSGRFRSRHRQGRKRSFRRPPSRRCHR